MARADREARLRGARLELAPGGALHLWQARLDLGEWPPASLLPRGERERAERLRPGARRRWAAARWALRGVLGRYLGEEPAAIGLRVDGQGKPLLAGPDPSLRFNLSHSGDLALVAIARGREVGVDVERIAPRRDVLALARRALGQAEARSVEEAPPRARPIAFHTAWTRREAIAKCHGAGLRGPLPAGAVSVSRLDAGPGYAAAIAVAGDGAPALRRFVAEPALIAPSAR